MPKYLIHGTYSAEGLRGLITVGGSARRTHFAPNGANLGGRLEAVYFAFGLDDIYAIVEMPDNSSTAALTMAISSGVAFRATTIALLSPEDVDAAAQQSARAGYRPPGQ